MQSYNNLILITPKSNQPEGIFNGFRKFISKITIKGSQVAGLELVIPNQGDIYLVLDDRSLIKLIKKLKQSTLKIGEDVGIIAYNDSLLKEIVEGGITTISTNFKEMGERMAFMINNDEFAQIKNPNNILIRKSL
nr:substrate-binding domain-containing protein [Winogradskyella ouciana]